MSNELLCYLLRISIKLLDVGEKSEKAASLDHVKKLKSCQDEVEYFEPETKQMVCYIRLIQLLERIGISSIIII